MRDASSESTATAANATSSRPRLSVPAPSAGAGLAHRPSFIRLLHPTKLAVLALVVALAALARFHGLEERGTDGSDTIYYTNLALSWAEGSRTVAVPGQQPVHRPALLLTFAAAIHLLGFEDSSIKTVVAAFDTANVLLVFVLALSICRNFWTALVPTALYASLPIAIMMARLELAHAVSTTPVLVATLLFLASFRVGKPAWMGVALCGASGVGLGWAALCHEDLLFAAAGLGLYALFASSSPLGAWARPAREAASLRILALLVGLVVTAYNPIERGFVRVVRPARLVESSTSTEAFFQWLQALVDYTERLSRFLWNATLATTSSVVVGAVGLISALLILRYCFRLYGRRGPSTPCEYHLPIFVVVGYMAAYCLTLDFFLSRVFLPLVPLLLIWISAWTHELSRCLGTRLSALLLIALTAGAGVSNLHAFSRTTNLLHRTSLDAWIPLLGPEAGLATGARLFKSFVYNTVPPRQLFDALADRVNSEAKVLITPSILLPYPGRRVFQLGYYFGDNAVYVIDHEEPIHELIARKNIRFVLFSSLGHRPSFMSKHFFTRYEYDERWNRRQRLRLGRSYGFASRNYSVDQEYAYLRHFVLSVGGRVVHLNGRATPPTRPAPETPPWTIVFELPQVPALEGARDPR